MKIRIISIIATIVGISLFSSCDKYDDDKIMAPDGGNTEVGGNEGLYFGEYKMTYSDNGAAVKSDSIVTVIVFASNLGNDNMKFEVYPMSFYNSHWYVPEKITEFTAHLTYDNDKLMGDDVSIRGAVMDFKHIFDVPKESGDIVVYSDEFYGFKQADAYAGVEFNPAGQYKGKFYAASIDLDNDEDFDRISDAVNRGEDPAELLWDVNDVYVNLTKSGSAKLSSGYTTFETRANIKIEVFTASETYPGYFASLWSGSRSVSTKGDTWAAQKDIDSYDVKGAVVGKDGKMHLDKTYTVKHNPDKDGVHVAGGIISGIWFEAEKCAPGSEIKIELEPKE